MSIDLNANKLDNGKQVDIVQDIDSDTIPLKLFLNNNSMVLPSDLSGTLSKIQDILEMPILLFIQRDNSAIDSKLCSEFLRTSRFLTEDKKVAVIIDSPGGDPHSAYRIARMFQSHCGGFVSVIPRRAKSAATLLSIAADDIIFNDFAEFGPLDIQMVDTERESWISGLDHVQSIERLNEAAMRALDSQIMFLKERTKKKWETLLPLGMKFVSSMFQPMFEKIDVVEYTQASRALKISKDYAYRLLIKNYDSNKSEKISDGMTDIFCDHGFVIDHRECLSLDLNVLKSGTELSLLLDSIIKLTENKSYFGLVCKEDLNETEND